MKKLIILIPIMILLFVGLVEAVDVSLNFSWQLSSSVIRPGGDTIIYLTLTNKGIDLSRVKIISTAGPFLTITSGKRIELEDLSSTTSQQVAISVKADKSAEASVSYVFLEIEYYYADSEYKKEVYVPITIRRDPIIEINNVKFNETIEPGKTVLLSFDVTNQGDSTARDLKINLNKTSLFTTPESTGEKIIKELNPHQSKNLNFLMTINPDAEIGIASMLIKFSYFDDTKTNDYFETKNIGLKISGNPDFVITIDSYSNFYYGRAGEVSITIANRGLAPAEYIQVIADSKFGSKEFYIGSLDSDDSETIDLPQILTKASGSYPIHLTLNYKDKFDNEYSFEKTVEAIPTNAPLDYTTISIIVVVLIIIMYWIYKKRKK